MVTSDWTNLFPSSMVLNEDTFSSNHTAIILELGRKKPEGFTKFRFENYWIGNQECKDIIQKGWDGSKGEITSQISRCASNLAELGLRQIKNFKKNISSCRRILQGTRAVDTLDWWKFSILLKKACMIFWPSKSDTGNKGQN